MRTDEIMLGDIFNYFGSYVKVVKIYEVENVLVKDYEGKNHYLTIDKFLTPISLNQEILEKNGFVKQAYDGWLISENNGRRLIEYRTDYIDGLLIINYAEEPYSKLSIKLKHVHELQHALRLCGIEKEIVL